jgi:hypothetical protein
MKKTRRCYLYGSKAQGICPFDVPGGTCRDCAESLAVFGNPQDVAGTNGVESNRANTVAGKEKSARRAPAGCLKKGTLFLARWFNDMYNHSPMPVTLPPSAETGQPPRGGRRDMNHQDYQVFHFEFIASGKWHSAAVASTDRKEAGNLILAMYEGVTALRERPKAKEIR